MKIFSKLGREKNFVSLMGNLLFAGLGFSSFLVLTRSLTKENFGIWVLYMTMATFFDLGRFGLTRNAIVRYISGQNDKEKKSYLGTSMVLELYLLAFVYLFCFSVYFILGHRIGDGFREFFIYYPFLATCNLSWNNAVSFLQAEQKFGQILSLKAINMGLFVSFLLVNLLWFEVSVSTIIIVNIISNLIASLYAVSRRWDGLSYLKEYNRLYAKKIIVFGKYSIGTFLGGSLLRSADAFVIGLSSYMGTASIAIYSVAMKLTELMEIPIRSFGATAFPKMSKESNDNNFTQVRTLFYEYTGAVVLLYIPLLLIGFVWSEIWVSIVGGEAFMDHVPTMALILRIFIVYGLFLPIDRMTGIVLDSLNKPEINFYKVVIMAIANIVGDLIAVFIFKSLYAVALVSIFFLICGIAFGSYYLRKYVNVHLIKIFPYGIRFYKSLLKRYFSKDDGIVRKS